MGEERAIVGTRSVCAVCASVHRTAIEEALIRKDSLDGILDFAGISKETVYRHQKRCLARIAALPPSSPERIDVLAAAQRVMNEAGRLGAKAEKRKDIRTALLAVREYARGAELVAKLQSDRAVDLYIERDPRWIELRDTILSALAPYPQALAAVVRALEARKAL